MNDSLYGSIDGNLILKPVAYCKSHRCYLSKKQMKTHQCTRKACTGLQKLDCPYWHERERRKQAAKERKQAIKETELQ